MSGNFAGTSLPPSAAAPYMGETYYGRPAVKASPFDWKVSSYIFVGGLAGSAQILATLGDLAGGPQAGGMTRTGRWIAVGGSAVGGVLLIADLHTPDRWYNMLRIYRSTSPMSIGTYILSGFAGFSAIALGADLLGMKRVAKAAQVPAAVAGAGMSVYTAALLSATSTPLWAAEPRLLGVRFAASSMAAAASALSVVEQAGQRQDTARTLDRVALAACAVEMAAGLQADRAYRRKGVADALEKPELRALDKVGALAMGAAIPILCHGLNQVVRKPSRTLSVLGSLAALAGGLALRHAILKGGNESAGIPENYFRLTRPEPPDRQPPRVASTGERERIAHHGERPYTPAATRVATSLER
ncbi:NrfD/PsrC family molybdoenzyme membrane anchor subunit [Azospirillum sp. SYSU D00513]|uniref:NrfD/PsrC family molybdoenzyme membrane anchor subunit n=1 Tax=Azospirillum sp. SYSU D00513 TaxID=2812561 RepID=UPI001A973234|nr:NrfD/PsrC family molybdoenzyme membrane anchor subunit [Azospirillum sp. SYSU D00513]